ncbi:hypothetical protein M422DRAFT_776313 [Sphaerobolus stellatus SS14]|nr:hypothetical protein M422DRAFT_776313 [Sphaerobolus stellatus SS14]
MAAPPTAIPMSPNEITAQAPMVAVTTLPQYEVTAPVDQTQKSTADPKPVTADHKPVTAVQDTQGGVPQSRDPHKE